ncbi:MAG: lamin tail domain-containing protein [Burkholderiales bacterium]|nr:lamin tail domain-containing protein [Burkholderiales bacterium]
MNTAIRLTPSFLSIALLAIAPLPALAALDLADLQPGQLLITEVMPDPAKVGDTSGEWFEIHNPLDIAINLTGLKVVSFASTATESFTVTGDHAIAAGGYFVFGRKADTAINGGLEVDYAWGTALSLGNSSDFLRLENADGAMLSQVTWTQSIAGISIDIASGQVPSFGSINLLNTPLGFKYGAGDVGTPGVAGPWDLQISGIPLDYPTGVTAPVPEPSTYFMLGAGLLSLAALRHQQRRIAIAG